MFGFHNPSRYAAYSININSIRVLQLQKGNYFVLYLAHELSPRKHLEDGSQPATSRGNLDSVTKAVT